ncbi:isochorismate synthase MenF [Castellaniella denitrificans]|uniref:isochorismate synthase n=1 Tax=Castellaniella denitrificans TaxID=56119 RepID=A0ABT4LZW4_9BURK|nr:isochorismate synthase [Castellaniella denitrificans]MCZ4328599.1 isochorismate synthase [Castellaniella denitrificans]
MDMLARTHPDPRAGDLAGFQPGDSLFTAQGLGFHGRGCLLRAAPREDVGACAARLLAQADELRAEADTSEPAAADASAARPLLLGLLPYDPAGPAPALLRVPRSLRRIDAPRVLPPARGGAIRQRREHPDQAGYERGVSAALERIARADGLRKLVLSRTLELELEHPLDLPEVLARLWRASPHGHTYALPVSEDGPDYFLGASPELLVRREGRRVRVHPLAGTAARHADATEDARIARALLDSPKDLLEHAVVVEAIEAALRPLCRTLDIPSRPGLTSTARLWHLGTLIEGELADAAISALDLAIALHPTPAVCGLPTADARRAIAALEPFERGYFAGTAGWCDAAGDGAWAVAIRCAHASGRRLTLSAGAGIVPGSVPELEYQETGNKLRTILDALGLH